MPVGHAALLVQMKLKPRLGRRAWGVKHEAAIQGLHREGWWVRRARHTRALGGGSVDFQDGLAEKLG